MSRPAKARPQRFRRHGHVRCTLARSRPRLHVLKTFMHVHAAHVNMQYDSKIYTNIYIYVYVYVRIHTYMYRCESKNVCGVQLYIYIYEQRCICISSYVYTYILRTDASKHSGLCSIVYHLELLRSMPRTPRQDQE